VLILIHVWNGTNTFIYIITFTSVFTFKKCSITIKIFIKTIKITIKIFIKTIKITIKIFIKKNILERHVCINVNYHTNEH